MHGEDFIYRPFNKVELMDWVGEEVYFTRTASECFVESVAVHYDRVEIRLQHDGSVYAMTPDEFLRDCTHSEGLKCGRPAVDYF